jgi:hypothetical protein
MEENTCLHVNANVCNSVVHNCPNGNNPNVSILSIGLLIVMYPYHLSRKKKPKQTNKTKNWSMQQYGWISMTCYMEDRKLEKLRNVWFRLNGILGIGIELRTPHMLGKCSTTLAMLPASMFIFCFWRRVLLAFLRLVLNSWSSCFHLPSSLVVYHDTWVSVYDVLEREKL